jgi:zinc protease
MRTLCCIVLAQIGLCAATAQIKLPPHSREVLPNGVVLEVMQRKGVPLVDIGVAIKGGMESDPDDEPGLSSIVADLLRKGTATKTAQQFSEAIDGLGGTIRTRADHQASLLESEFLSKDLSSGLALVADAVARPSFDDAEVKKLVAQRIDDIKALKDDPAEAIESYVYSFFFEKAHPYGRVVNEMSLRRITRDQIREFHKREYVGRNIIVAVVGDIDPEHVKAEVKRTFGSLPAGEAYRWHAPIHLPESPHARLLLVNKPQATQTYFYIAQPGIHRTDPDRIPLQLVDIVFGGRFTSMLNEALRIKSGLTYGAQNIIERDRLQGMNAISTFTKTDTTANAIDLALQTLGALRDQGITADQLASAKAYMKGVYPRHVLESTSQLASLLLQLDVFGLDDSEITELFHRIDDVTLAKANEIARTHFQISGLVFVLLGDGEKIRPVTSKYAPERHEVSITSPGFGL